MRPARAVLLATTLAAISACGARTRLDDARASQGGGGAATIATSTTNGELVTTSVGPTTVGTGGGLLCTPQIADVFSGVNDGQRPALTPLDDGRVALSFAAGDVALPPVPRLVSVAIDPWGAWPPNTNTAVEMLPDAGASFAVARGATSALAFAGERKPSFGVLYAETGVDVPSPIADVVTSAPRSVRFLANHGPLLLGLEAVGNATEFFETWLVKPTPEGPFFQGPILMGCALSTIAADAIPLSDGAGVDGFLVAFGRGGTVGGGPSCDGASAASALQIASVTTAGEVAMGALIGKFPSLTEDLGVPRVRLAPRVGGGAWALWFGKTLFGEDTPPPALLLTEIAPGLVDGGTATIANIDSGDGFAIAPIGAGLLLAWSEASPNGEQRIVVRSVDGGFATVGEQSFPVDGALDADMAIVPSPSEDAAVVAWSSRSGDMKTPHRVHLAKICLPAL